MPTERPFVGARNFEVLLDCGDYLSPLSCAADLFWRGIHNTLTYVIFEVSGIMLFSIRTAVIFNCRIAARGFFRGVFFYPALLSSVVVALLWGWILQRTGWGWNRSISSSSTAGRNSGPSSSASGRISAFIR